MQAHNDFCIACGKNRPENGCFIHGIVDCPVRKLFAIPSPPHHEPVAKLTQKDLERDWPLFITGLSWLRTKDDKGIGDTVKHALSYMGGTQFEWVMKRLGIDCGCGSRQDWLNARYPYDRD